MIDKLIAIVGLGYVGLPLAVEFGKKAKVFGFDINKKRVSELKKGVDSTLESSFEEIVSSKNLSFTSNIEDIKNCNIYIIAVPTPLDEEKKPNLNPLIQSSKAVGNILKKGDIVIYESTVYPGATEEVCVPILEKYSRMVFNQDFYCGYSPERINPGDKINRLTDIKKVTSGSTLKTADIVDSLYNEIILAGTYKAGSIKIAESSKVVENTQRDVNIALMNEFSLIFNKLGIDTEDVLKAAESKWNFLPFRPGLVGGHCIHVDPHYLAFKAKQVGYNPEIILAGRRLNNSMGVYVASEVTKLMEKKRIDLVNSNVLVMGLTFKENCPDMRNTNVVNLVKYLEKSNCNVQVYDPWVDPKIAKLEYDINMISFPLTSSYDAIIISVAHEEFKKMSIEKIKTFGKNNYVIYDVKYLFDSMETDGRL
jgi:UDP-N-acetyl-D-glucosamine/UDP-N-acetyl-D-galactosamine dehydrogenase